MDSTDREHPEEPEDFDPRPYIEAATWRFAKSEPVHRHWYVVAAESPDLDAHFAFRRLIAKRGRREHFAGYGDRDPEVGPGVWKYLRVDEFDYWCSGPKGSILNRRAARPEPTPAELGQLDLGLPPQ